MKQRPQDYESLPEIPVVDAPGGPLELARLRSASLPHIVAVTREIIPSFLLRLGDSYAADCLRRNRNPYLAEIDAVAELLREPGAYALNFSFEMGCTTSCKAPDDQSAMRLYRTLDWPFRLGGDVVVARHSPAAGPYFSVTWPGFVGVLTGLARGRFAAAINQPPMNYAFAHFGLGLPIDWAVNRWRVNKATGLPPAHLLRQTFERCATYAEAKAMLVETPVCIPVIYTLTGTDHDSGCIIERRENDAIVHEGPVCITNHWLNGRFKGRPHRGANSRRRLAAMQATLPSLSGEPFSWLRPPVLDSLTRLAAELDAATGDLIVQGWAGETPQTRIRTVTMAQAAPTVIA